MSTAREWNGGTGMTENGRKAGGGSGAVVKKLHGDRYYSVVSAVAVLTVLGLWAVITNTIVVGSDGFPSPQSLLSSFFELIDNGYTGISYGQHILTSLSEALSGFIMAVIVGVLVGLTVGYYRLARAIIMPFVDFLRPIPPISLVTLFVFYFGIGMGSKVALIFLTGLWFMIMATADGVKGIPLDYYRAARSMGMNPGQIFRHVVLPGALPSILIGMRTALAICWALVVAAELIAAQAGLGYIITDASNFYRLPIVYVAVLTIAVLGFLMDRLLVLLNHRALFWQGK